MSNLKNKFAGILSKAMEQFDPSVEDDISVLTIIADTDSNQLIFGGLKLREDLEEEGRYDEDSQVFYEAKLESLKEECEEVGASELFNIMSKAINSNNELSEKLDGLLLYGWYKVDEEFEDVDNFWAS